MCFGNRSHRCFQLLAPLVSTGKKKVDNMKVDMMADMKVDKVADMKVDGVGVQGLRLEGGAQRAHRLLVF